MMTSLPSSIQQWNVFGRPLTAQSRQRSVPTASMSAPRICSQQADTSARSSGVSSRSSGNRAESMGTSQWTRALKMLMLPFPPVLSYWNIAHETLIMADTLTQRDHRRQSTPDDHALAPGNPRLLHVDR